MLFNSTLVPCTTKAVQNHFCTSFRLHDQCNFLGFICLISQYVLANQWNDVQLCVNATLILKHLFLDIAIKMGSHTNKDSGNHYVNCNELETSLLSVKRLAFLQDLVKIVG